MDKSMMKGIAVGGLAMVVLGASGFTGYQALTQPTFADVAKTCRCGGRRR
jgi:hypothetical protein